MNGPRVGAVGLLPSSVDETLEAIRAYHPSDFKNGCMLEAAVFADWFMADKLAGERSWAQPVSIEARVAGKVFPHAVALFQIGCDLFCGTSLTEL